MKIKKILLVFSFALFFSCTKDEEIPEVPTETITVENGLNINFANLTVATIDGEAPVDVNGNFIANIDNTLVENLPILFIKNNEIMFGYYSKTGLNNTISTNDILLFYFTLHPEIAQQNFSNSELLTKIKQNSNYLELTNLVKTSLSENISPFNNTSFVSLINQSGLDIGVAEREAKQSKNKDSQTFEFRYTYSRDGNIIWNSKFPLYATVGMEVVDISTGVSVSGPQILDNKGLVLSPGSAVEWIYDYLTTEEIENTGKFKFPKDGKYEVRFTNGVDNFGTKALEGKVDLINRFNLGVSVISIAMPVGVKKWLGDNDCRDEMINLFKNLKLAPATLVITDKVAMDKFVKDLAKDTYAVSVRCIPSVQKKYLDYIELLTKRFNVVEEASTLYLLLRDYVFSNIQGKETRYYYDGISFGELQLTNTTDLKYITPAGTEFQGQPKSQHIFTASINETTYKYSINRSPIQSTIIPDLPNKEYAIDLPFEVNKTNAGNATLSGDKTIYTNNEGKLAASFVMGTTESKFEIKPAFKNSGLSYEVVNLVKVDSIAIYKEAFKGKWKIRHYDGLNGTERFWDLELFEDGTGIVKYPDPNTTLGYTNYRMKWYIEGNGPYYYSESGWWNFSFGFGLTYPVIKYIVETGDGSPAGDLNPGCSSCINKYITEYTKN